MIISEKNHLQRNKEKEYVERCNVAWTAQVRT